jgi:hypothetical protein
MRTSFLVLIVVASSLVAVSCASSAPADNEGGIPRLSNGKPDMSGIWDRPRVQDMSQSSTTDLCANGVAGCKQVGPGELPFTEWGREKFSKSAAETLAFDPGIYCLPEGYVRSWATTYPAEIIQRPERMAVLFENYGAFHVIPTDGREHPQSLEPSWFGNSVGHWEDDTLVVDTIGFNDKTWIDTAQHPHSEQLHVVERFNRIDATHLGYEVTIEDPKVFTMPWKNTRVFTIMEKGQELMEHVCMENNKEVMDKVQGLR